MTELGRSTFGGDHGSIRIWTADRESYRLTSQTTRHGTLAAGGSIRRSETSALSRCRQSAGNREKRPSGRTAVSDRRFRRPRSPRGSRQCSRKEIDRTRNDAELHNCRLGPVYSTARFRARRHDRSKPEKLHRPAGRLDWLAEGICQGRRRRTGSPTCWSPCSVPATRSMRMPTARFRPALPASKIFT